MKREAIETAVEKAVQQMIVAELGDDNFPVYRSDQTPASGDIQCIVLTATSDESPELINEGGKPLLSMSLETQLWSLAPMEEGSEMSERWNAIYDAMMSETVPADVDLSRFDAFVVMSGSKSETDIDEKGRRTRIRSFSLKVQDTPG